MSEFSFMSKFSIIYYLVLFLKILVTWFHMDVLSNNFQIYSVLIMEDILHCLRLASPVVCYER